MSVGRWLFALFLSSAATCDALAEADKRFIDINACMRGSFSQKVCTDAFDDAWDVYSERAPKFKTREKCNMEFKVCVVFNPPAIAGRPAPRLTPDNVSYAPPLLGIVMSKEGSALQVLIDTTRRSLGVGVPSRRTPPPQAKPRSFSGNNFGPQSGSFTLPEQRVPMLVPQTTLENLPIDAPGVSSLEGVSSYPVPASRRRNKN